jgi:serine/threonine protein phosphatase PrpC
VAATRVDADELIAQFVGVHDEHGGWETEPVASPNLIHAICVQLRPASREALREQRRDRRRRRRLGLL